MMGRDPSTSVVNADQRCWDYDNLYLVGGGSMPTVSTSNVTLTIAALCLRSIRAMLTQLDSETAPIEISPNGATRGRLQEVSR
jgi:choline dehydrogenase-like flavoprotein